MSDDLDRIRRWRDEHREDGDLEGPYSEQGQRWRDIDLLLSEIDRLQAEIDRCRAATPTPLLEATVVEADRGRLVVYVDPDDVELRQGEELAIWPAYYGPLSEAEATRVITERDELADIVRTLASADNDLGIAGDVFQGRFCRYCDAPEGCEHQQMCEWRRAKELLGDE
jgi:hypothetical protein